MLNPTCTSRGPVNDTATPCVRRAPSPTGEYGTAVLGGTSDTHAHIHPAHTRRLGGRNSQRTLGGGLTPAAKSQKKNPPRGGGSYAAGRERRAMDRQRDPPTPNRSAGQAPVPCGRPVEQHGRAGKECSKPSPAQRLWPRRGYNCGRAPAAHLLQGRTRQSAPSLTADPETHTGLPLSYDVAPPPHTQIPAGLDRPRR